MNDIEHWVNKIQGTDELQLRQAIHLILLAVSRDNSLSQTLALKGGLMMAIVYSSDRFTTDIDLSLLDNEKKMNKEELEMRLSRQLKAVVATTDYPINLLVHSIQDRPKKNPEKATFPAYKVKIGFADTRKSNALKRLEEKQSPYTVEIDLSFNESVGVNDVECFKLQGKYNVLCYSLEQLMAEKYRSILQQVVRNRNRRQDIYDIYHLLQQKAQFLSQAQTKSTILKKLFKSSVGKGIANYLNKDGMKATRMRFLESFHTLLLEIDTDVPAETMYNTVQDYFESLPWKE